MRKIIVGIVLALVTFMAALTFSTQRSEPINQLVIFGDSLSDTGTVFQATNGSYPPDPPYFQGRYSNGRVWVEYLAERLGLAAGQINNLAYGGSTTSGGSNSLVPGLLNQVRSFTQTPQVNATALYVLWAGANDYLQGTSDAATPVKNIMDAVSALSQAGAKRVLVTNLPNLGQLPATRSGANAANLTALTQSHNQGLRRALKLLGQQQPELEVITLDANALYQAAITQPAQFGFTNVTGACISGSSACSNPDQFLFWDGIHPTMTAHQILGKQAFADIEEHLPLNAGR